MDLIRVTGSKGLIRFGDKIVTPQQYLDEKWVDVAAYAWEGFKAYGRGAVVWDIKTEQSAMRGYIYLTIEGMRSHLGEQPGDNGMLRILRHAEAYDPENDAIFILIVQGDATIIHRSSTGCLTPPEAAEEVARRQVN